jgi:hypothetical protein
VQCARVCASGVLPSLSFPPPTHATRTPTALFSSAAAALRGSYRLCSFGYVSCKLVVYDGKGEVEIAVLCLPALVLYTRADIEL